MCTSDEEIKAIIGKIGCTYTTLKPMWRSTARSTWNKLRIFNCDAIFVLLSGLETWRVTNTLTRKLQTLINFLRSIFKIR